MPEELKLAVRAIAAEARASNDGGAGSGASTRDGADAGARENPEVWKERRSGPAEVSA